MNTIVELSFLYCLVFLAIGFALFWTSRQVPKLWPWSLFRIGALLHFALGMLILFVAVVLSNDSALTPSCEWVPNTSTTAGSVVSYTWVNTCAAVTFPTVFNVVTTILGWVLWAEAFIVFLLFPLWWLVQFIRGKA